MGVRGSVVWWLAFGGVGAACSAPAPTIESPGAYTVPVDSRNRPCRALAGSPSERLRACLAAQKAAPLSAAAGAVLDDMEDDKVLAVGSVKANFPVLGLADVPGLEELLLGTDEEKVAAAVRRAKIRGLVVARDLIGALDRDSVVLARLAHHDFLEWFQLRYVTADLMIYTVRSSPARLPIEDGDALLAGLRARLEGRPVPRQPWDPEVVRLIGSFRLQGSTLVQRHVAFGDGKQRGAAPAVELALDDLADKLRREWDREVEIKGFGRFEDRLKDLRLEIHVVMERAPVEPRSRFEIFDLWEMGVDGMMFRQRAPEGSEQLEERFTYLPGSELVTRSLHSPDEFLRAATKEFGWVDERPWEKDPRTRLDLFRDQHFMESTPGGGPAVRLVRGMPEVPMSWVTDRNVQDMLIAGGEWWLANQFPDGRFEYKYWPEQNRSSTEYNEVRHILATRDLADTWRYRRDSRYLDGARRAMDWLLRYEVDGPTPGPLPSPPPGTMLFRYPQVGTPNQKLGTVAVGLLGWLSWADATGSHAEDTRIREMAKFVLAMVEPDGRFRPYFVQPGHPYEKERNDIVPGEAMLALGLVAEYFGESEWVAPYGKFVEYYRPWFRQRAARKRDVGRWPHDTYTDLDRLDLVQFGPWSVMAAKQVYKLTKDPMAKEFGLEVGDWMVDNYQWSEERSPWPDYVGGYYKLPMELPAMQTFCYSEGTAAAYTLAFRSGDPRAEKFARATAEAIRFLEVMQFDEVDSYPFSRPEKIRGGIKYTMNENKIRIDYVGHGMSTLSQWLDARGEDPAVTQTLWDPADLTRPAGTRGSVPGLDYSARPVTWPSGERSGRAAAAAYERARSQEESAVEGDDDE
jgi:hypothetical protein